MTTLLDRIDSPTMSTSSTTPAADRLRATMAASRVSWAWLGTQKALTREQKALAALAFDAEGACLSAGKKLLDTRHDAFRAVTAVRGRADAHWRALTLPYPEAGVRLIRHDDVEAFDEKMAGFRAELDDAVAGLDRHYAELRRAAANRLGSLYNAADYPETLVGLFGLNWDFPNVEPPDYLLALSPGLYEAERSRVAARFEEAVSLAERAFTEEFARLVEHLCERVSGPDDDGSPKVFRDSAVANLVDFFDRFKALNVRSNADLDDLVARAQRAVSGVAAQDLRDSPPLRQRVAEGLTSVQSSLDAMLIERPRRRILRQAAATGVA